MLDLTQTKEEVQREKNILILKGLLKHGAVFQLEEIERKYISKPVIIENINNVYIIK